MRFEAIITYIIFIVAPLFFFFFFTVVALMSNCMLGNAHNKKRTQIRGFNRKPIDLEIIYLLVFPVFMIS